jgi:hypothetical protein
MVLSNGSAHLDFFSRPMEFFLRHVAPDDLQRWRQAPSNAWGGGYLLCIRMEQVYAGDPRLGMTGRSAASARDEAIGAGRVVSKYVYIPKFMSLIKWLSISSAYRLHVPVPTKPLLAETAVSHRPTRF